MTENSCKKCVVIAEKHALWNTIQSLFNQNVCLFQTKKKGDPLCVHFRQVTHYVFTLDRVHCSLVYSSFNLSSTTFAYDMPRESDGTELLYKVL